ncbi:hypothetical protein QWM81_12740 [Streptomyces ficellus]|uniref:Uncharacterized protein n=1 Tax=Streptomyces ficellus TaxID=1977088 RepID=A0ABT7Z5Y0_9ACTN|nr:hypothetical protein [Streptomyces ficellus]MDN3294903.1 hypothetical protein [Streptomyces ficellus]
MAPQDPVLTNHLQAEISCGTTLSQQGVVVTAELFGLAVRHRLSCQIFP